MAFVIIGILVVLTLYVVLTYNKFIKLIQRSKDALADINVQLKRRYDLIPNLMDTVKGYAAHERETFEAVTQARAAATATNIDTSNITAEQITAMAGAESALSGALGRLLAVAESYPDLKADQNFAQLQNELTDTENKIQAARRFFNSNIRDLKIALESFPSNIIAGMFNFTKTTNAADLEYFELEADSAAREPVKVSF